MIPTPAHIASKSFAWYRKSVVYQVLIIAVLSAVITGSLLTGSSVRNSLKSISSSRLGNTGIVVTSGLRYFNPELEQRLGKNILSATTSLLESTGSCQSMTTQVLVPDASVYIVDSSFFSFHGIEGTAVGNGSVAINAKLAARLGVKEGDEVIIRIPSLSDIPADAPFAPEKETGISFVRRIGVVLDEARAGNFSLSISQLVPDNIFISRYDLDGSGINPSRANRILIAGKEAGPADSLHSALKRSMRPSDIGLRIRSTVKTGETEIISDRIFLDEAMIGAIKGELPAARPLITYLLNSIVSGKGMMTPYSFAAALPSEMNPVENGEGLVINNWLSDDTGAKEGDSLEISWYSPDSLNSLVTRARKFRVIKVAEMAGIYADSLLMPEFPGIAGSESCSRWDAGVPVDLGSIRDKDEEYWNMHGGTPKVFMDYATGAALWGNNFGPATALRIPPGDSAIEVENKLAGSIDPSVAGLRLQNILEESVRAAEQGVDFSTLFLSLGFFMILSALILLYLSVSTYFDSKKDQLRVFISLGFTRRLTHKVSLI
ncbi:MAG: hypothetical protein MUD02_08950 [Bacteroidales bacterium]|nr:hypothetical protein [Bacteroidales bacterium]